MHQIGSTNWHNRRCWHQIISDHYTIAGICFCEIAISSCIDKVVSPYICMAPKMVFCDPKLSNLPALSPIKGIIVAQPVPAAGKSAYKSIVIGRGVDKSGSSAHKGIISAIGIGSTSTSANKGVVTATGIFCSCTATEKVLLFPIVFNLPCTSTHKGIIAAKRILASPAALPTKTLSVPEIF